VVVSIDLANASAAHAFDLAAETVAGRATHRVVGGPAGVPEEVFRRLVVEEGIAPAAPVVEGFAVLPATGGGQRALRLLGVETPIRLPADLLPSRRRTARRRGRRRWLGVAHAAGVDGPPGGD
jgi:putative ABC transport system permease protein